MGPNLNPFNPFNPFNPSYPSNPFNSPLTLSRQHFAFCILHFAFCILHESSLSRGPKAVLNSMANGIFRWC